MSQSGARGEVLGTVLLPRAMHCHFNASEMFLDKAVIEQKGGKMLNVHDNYCHLKDIGSLRPCHRIKSRLCQLLSLRIT